MPRTKSITESTEKWTTRVSQSSNYYLEGTRGKGAEWQAAALEASDNYAAGVQAAIATDRFSRGIQEAGPQAWEAGVAAVGPARWAAGAQAKKDKYQRKMAGVLSVIEGVTLPPRGPKGSPENYMRVQAIGEALHDAKMAGSI